DRVAACVVFSVKLDGRSEADRGESANGEGRVVAASTEAVVHEYGIDCYLRRVAQSSVADIACQSAGRRIGGIRRGDANPPGVAAAAFGAGLAPEVSVLNGL